MIKLRTINSGWILFIKNSEALDYLILCHDLSVHHDPKVNSQVGGVVRVNG